MRLHFAPRAGSCSGSGQWQQSTSESSFIADTFLLVTVVGVANGECSQRSLKQYLPIALKVFAPIACCMLPDRPQNIRRDDRPPPSTRHHEPSMRRLHFHGVPPGGNSTSRCGASAIS